MPLPLFTATRLTCPPTFTRIAAELSFTVPVNWGRWSFVFNTLTVTTGAVLSTVSSFVVLSVPALAAASVAVAATLNVPFGSAVSVLFAKVQVPLPLLVAARVCPFTTMDIDAAVSLTVPLRGGVVSVVASVFTVIVGTIVSTVSSLFVPSVPALPAVSVAVATTSNAPLPSAEREPFARVQVPVPLFVAVRVWPPTVMDIVAVVSLIVPERGGVLSFVVNAVTVIVGAVVSITSSFVVASAPAFPAVSVAVAATL